MYLTQDGEKPNDYKCPFISYEVKYVLGVDDEHNATHNLSEI